MSIHEAIERRPHGLLLSAIEDRPNKKNLEKASSLVPFESMVTSMRHIGSTTLADTLDARRSAVIALNASGRRVLPCDDRRAKSVVARAWYALLRLRLDKCNGYIAELEKTIEGLSPLSSERLTAEVAMLRAAALALADESIDAMRVALRHCTDNPNTVAGMLAGTICRLGYWKLGDLRSFFSLKRSSRSRSSRGQVISEVLDLSIEAEVAVMRLQLPVAKRLAADALSTANRHLLRAPWFAAAPASVIAQVYYEEGFLNESEALLTDRLDAIRAGANVETAIRAYSLLARIAAHRQQPDFALLLLCDAEKLGEQRRWPRLVATAVGVRLDLLFKSGCREAAEECAVRLRSLSCHARDANDFVRAELARCADMGEARIAMAEAPTKKLLDTLHRVHHCAVQGNDLYQAVQVAARLAAAMFLANQTEEAIELCLGVTRIGAAVGLYRSLLEEQDAFRDLLQLLADRITQGTQTNADELLPYIACLLNPGENETLERRGPKLHARSGHSLSPRERNILRSVARGCSNKQIARELLIAPETIKSHLKHIFGKLAAKTRAEAVMKAEHLGLL